MNDKNVKVGMSPLNWVLSFIGIIILSSFIALPPLFRIMYAVEEEVEDISGKIAMETLVCTIKDHKAETHTYNETITMRYYIDQIRTYTKTKEQFYTEVETYETDKLAFGRLAAAYSLVDGVTYIVNQDTVNLKINLTEKYDLGLFKERDITLPGDTEPIKVSSTYSLTDSLNKVKADLTALGYTCTNTTE